MIQIYNKLSVTIQLCNTNFKELGSISLKKILIYIFPLDIIKGVQMIFKSLFFLNFSYDNQRICFGYISFIINENKNNSFYHYN